MMSVEEGTVDKLSFCLKVTRFPGSIFRHYWVTSPPTGTAKSKTIETFLFTPEYCFAYDEMVHMPFVIITHWGYSFIGISIFCATVVTL